MNALAKLLSVFITNKRELFYAYSKTQLGQKLCGVKAPIALGCVETFENVFYGCFGRHVQQGVGTGGLYDALKGSIRFRELGIGEPALRGDILIAVTGQGLKGTVGHVGIYGDNAKIYSNNSLTGIFDDHLDLGLWISRYSVSYKMPLHVFRIIV